MVFRAGRLSFSEVGRPFWVLVALAVLLLAWVSIGLAGTTSTRLLVEGLRRDLAALRLQLEPRERSSLDIGRRTAAFNADVGDGGPAFRHASLVTLGRAAGRRLERLMVALGDAGDPAGAARAAALRLQMVDLQRRIEELGKAGDADARARAPETERLIVILDQRLAALLGNPTPN